MYTDSYGDIIQVKYHEKILKNLTHKDIEMQDVSIDPSNYPVAL